MVLDDSPPVRIVSKHRCRHAVALDHPAIAKFDAIAIRLIGMGHVPHPGDGQRGVGKGEAHNRVELGAQMVLHVIGKASFGLAILEDRRVLGEERAHCLRVARVMSGAIGLEGFFSARDIVRRSVHRVHLMVRMGRVVHLLREGWQRYQRGNKRSRRDACQSLGHGSSILFEISEPESHADDIIGDARILSGGPRKIRAGADAPFLRNADIGCEFARELVA